MEAVDVLFPGEHFVIRSLNKTVLVRPWTVRMILKDIPVFIERIFKVLSEKGQPDSPDWSSIISALGDFSDDILLLISKSVSPNLELEELYEMPAGECVRLLEVILKVNEDFFDQLKKVLLRFRGGREQTST